MIGNPGGFCFSCQGFELFKIIKIQGVGAADSQGNPMLYDGIAVENSFQVFKRLSSVDHEIFADDFKPVDFGIRLEYIFIMGDAQTDADAQIRKMFCIICHKITMICLQNKVAAKLNLYIIFFDLFEP